MNSIYCYLCTNSYGFIVIGNTVVASDAVPFERAGGIPVRADASGNDEDARDLSATAEPTNSATSSTVAAAGCAHSGATTVS